MKGFSTATPKLIENKFALGEPTKELLEDWDARAVQSILELHDVVEADKYCCECLLSRNYIFLMISKKVDAEEIQLRFLSSMRFKPFERQTFLHLFRNCVFRFIEYQLGFQSSD